MFQKIKLNLSDVKDIAGPPIPEYANKFHKFLYSNVFKLIFTVGIAFISGYMCLTNNVALTCFAYMILEEVKDFILNIRIYHEYKKIVTYGKRYRGRLVSMKAAKYHTAYPFFTFEDERGAHKVQGLITMKCKKKEFSKDLYHTYNIWCLTGNPMAAVYSKEMEPEKFSLRFIFSMIENIFICAGACYLMDKYLFPFLNTAM